MTPDIESLDHDPSRRDLQEARWLRLARLCGEEGRRWADGFRASPYHASLGTLHASLLQLRAHRRREARRTLAELEASLEDPSIEDPSFAKIFERFLCGVLAYDHFVLGDFEAADATLGRGENALVEVLETRPFLLAMANVFEEFRVQRARIAREQRDWDAVERHLRAAYSMLVNERPLCRLQDGREIYVRTLIEHYEGLDLAPIDQRQLQKYRSGKPMIEGYFRLVGRIPVPRDFVIPYA